MLGLMTVPNKRVEFQLPESMHARWQARADEMGLSLAAWIRLRCNGTTDSKPASSKPADSQTDESDGNESLPEKPRPKPKKRG